MLWRSTSGLSRYQTKGVIVLDEKKKQQKTTTKVQIKIYSAEMLDGNAKTDYSVKIVCLPFEKG